MPKPIHGSHRYMAGLDGLRALAVIAVIAYHLNLSWAPGGLLGVGVFFVLSGYLITDLLAAEWKRTTRIDLRDFWIRRARRLFPALLVMIVVVLTWVTLFDHSRLLTLRGDILAAVLYISNWWFIFHKVSYFASFGPPSPLGHLWSLAVEEQFYLVWPLVLALAFRYAPKRGPLISWTLAAAMASALTMALIYQPGTDPSRVYYGTDTRAFSLLIGATLAWVWPSRKLTSSILLRQRLALDFVGGIGLLVVLLMIWKTNQYEVFLYRGGLVLLSVASAMLVAALAHPASILGRILAWQPLRWLGTRSYGIYLWHYPVIVLTSPAVNTGRADLSLALFQVAASLGLAALSWKFIEKPILQGASERRRAQIRNRRWRPGRVVPVRRFLTASFAFLLISVCFVGMTHEFQGAAASFVPAVGNFAPTKAVASPEPEKGTTAGKKLPPSSIPTGTNATYAGNATNAGAANATNGGDRSKTHPASQARPAIASVSGHGVTAIGDSVLIDAAPDLQKLLPGIVIDGHIGRQLLEATAVVDQLKSEGKLGSRVIIELGTNGPFSKDDLVSLLRSIGPVKEIVLVNTRVQRPWENVVNATLAEVAATFPKTRFVDWYAASANKYVYFYPDGVHLDPQGSQAYATLVAAAIESAQLQP